MALSISLTDKINVFMTQKCVVKKFHNGTIQTFSFFTGDVTSGGKLGSETY